MTALRLVATDLDGTLLGPDGLIADADRRALASAVAAGVRIAVATGRPLRWLGCLDAIADLGPFVVVSNGAAVVDLASREVVRSHPLPRETLVALASELRDAVPGVRFAVEQGMVFGCEPDWLSHLPDTTRSRAQEDATTIRAPWDELLDQVTPVVKMLVLHREHDIERLHGLATAVVGDRAVVTHSVLDRSRAMLELSAPGVTKASALAELCDELGVPPEHVVAFGDMPNDLAMLDWAGRGYAMADAHPLLRERFEVVGSHADGGVGAKVLELLGASS